MLAIVLACGAGLVLGGLFAFVLAPWRPAFPALFLAGVAAFLAWSAAGLWSESADETLDTLAAFLALLGWIVGITGALTARRGRRALRTRDVSTHSL